MCSNKDFYCISENDHLRSEYIRKMLQNPLPYDYYGKTQNVQIPKIIIQFWHDFNNIPNDVNDCLKS